MLSPAARHVQVAGLTSPIAAAFALPVDLEFNGSRDTRHTTDGQWWTFTGYTVIALSLNLTLLLTMIWMFNARWRVAA